MQMLFKYSIAQDNQISIAQDNQISITQDNQIFSQCWRRESALFILHHVCLKGMGGEIDELRKAGIFK
jgi:hypothetical protein